MERVHFSNIKICEMSKNELNFPPRQTVCKIRNRWVQECCIEHGAGYQPPVGTNNRENRHLTCMALMHYTAISRALSQEMESFARQVSARTIQRCLQQHGLG